MSESRPAKVHQEPLIVVSEQTGQLAPRDFTDELAVPLVERNLHLQNVITSLAGINMARGFLSFDGPSEQSYGPRAEEMRENVQKKLENLTTEAKVEFARATGHYAMLDAGQPKADVQRETRSSFSDFLKLYGGPRNYVRAQAFRRHLARELDTEQDTTAQNTDLSFVFHDTDTSVAGDTETRELPKLEGIERLQTILEDPRAGFLPATNREANQVLTYLDYIHNPDYPLGVSNQLLEVFMHEQKVTGAGWRQGHRAIESIVYELGDYLANAMNSHAALSELQVLLQDCPNPKVTLAEEVGDQHPAYAVMARYSDDLEFSQTGSVTGLNRKPLRTREDRWADEGSGKHKTVEDQYTSKEPKPLFAKRIALFPASTTVGEARKTITDALTNEEKRAEFMIARLKDAKMLPGKRLFRSIFDIIETSLAA